MTRVKQPIESRPVIRETEMGRALCDDIPRSFFEEAGRAGMIVGWARPDPATKPASRQLGEFAADRAARVTASPVSSGKRFF
jgi:hypothetical protein